MNNEQNKVNNQEQTENIVERLAVADDTQTNKIVSKISANTYVPITVLVAVIAVGIYIGALTTKVDAMVDRDSPTRGEFNSICKQLTDIQNGVNDINKYLLNKK